MAASYHVVQADESTDVSAGKGDAVRRAMATLPRCRSTDHRYLLYPLGRRR